MREHLLCPSTEGCHAIARPWSGPLGDFAVEEFLALYRLFCPNEGEISICPLGDSAEVEQARVRLRHAIGPVAIKTQLAETTATEIGKRLVTGTLHEIICEGRDAGEVRQAILGCHEINAFSESEPATRPHALLLQFPGESTTSCNPLQNYGAKRRKQFLQAILKGTYFDPNNDDETNGCGGRENMNGKNTNSSDDKIIKKRPHVCVLWYEHRKTFCVTKPTHPESAIAFVKQCAPISNVSGFNKPQNSSYKAAPPTPALAAALTNLCQITNSKLVLDPFCGTGGLLLPVLVLGAPTAIGIDVTPVVDDSASNTNRHLDKIEIITGNVFSLPMRKNCSKNINFKVDSIVCDPPYGLRAPRIAVTNSKDALVVDAVDMSNATANFMDPVFEFAGDNNGLAIGGRIVFLSPTHWSKDEGEQDFFNGDAGSDLVSRKLRRENTDVDSDDTQASHPSLRLICTCAQEFKCMTRRVVIYEKVE